MNPSFIKNILFSIVVVFLAFLYVGVSRAYPFYFIWDMDHSVTVDLLFLQSGRLPSNLTHPGYGLKFLLFFIQKIGYLTGALSVSDLSSVNFSLNPIICVAELTDFNRLVSPFLALSIVLLLWGSLEVYFKPDFKLSIFILLFLGLEESLIYHCSMIRSELYSVFYLCSEVFFILLAAKTQKLSVKTISLVIAGTLSGLAFMTKVQAYILTAFFLPLLTCFVLYVCEPQKKETDGVKKMPVWLFAVSIFNTVTMGILLFSAYNFIMPEELTLLFTGVYGFTKISISFTIMLGFMFFFTTLLFFVKRFYGNFVQAVVFVNLMLFGFILSVFSHFLLLKSTSSGYVYLLADLKAVFFDPLFTGAGGFMGYFNKTSEQFLYNPALFITNLLLIAFLISGYFLKLIRAQWMEFVILAAVCFFCYLNIFIGTRFILRDHIWVEVFANFLSLFLFLFIALRLVKFKKVFSTAFIAIFIFLFYINVLHSKEMPIRINANYNTYGWKILFTQVYCNNPYEYYFSEPMVNSYSMNLSEEGLMEAAKSTENYRWKKHAAAFVFPGVNLNLRHIGYVAKTRPVWTDLLYVRIADFPDVLKDAMVVDVLTALGDKNTALPFYFDPKSVISNDKELFYQSEYQDKLRKEKKSGFLPVLTRQDLDVYLFVDKVDFPQFNKTPDTKSLTIKLFALNSYYEYSGIKIDKYTELELKKFTKRYFFVIKNNYHNFYCIPSNRAEY
ncbi:MAG: hypothetical protein HQK88_09725 [Nitrospirae bacterium]|nr:hypothetical protein [Nitrospirota bacterium]MBF0534450.1 hypothetical protein [Nitrospirota bacterium]MBF0617076.1 hypothetical protein [Nitrospirota bacterium]